MTLLKHNSRCLLVESSSKNKWSYTYRTYIEVQKGDVFSFEGFARVPDKDLSLAFTIASFDKDRKIVLFNPACEQIATAKVSLARNWGFRS